MAYAREPCEGRPMTQAKLDKFQVNKAALKALLCSPMARGVVEAKARAIAATANGMYGAKGYGVRTKVGSGRVHSFVYTGDAHTMNSNAAHNTLTKALGGGKLCLTR